MEYRILHEGYKTGILYYKDMWRWMQSDACVFIDKVQRVDAKRIQHRNLGEGSAALSGVVVCHKIFELIIP